MKRQTQFKILLCNGYVLLLCIAIVIAIPLQFVLLLINRNKTKLIKPLEEQLFITLFYITDLRKSVNPSNPFNNE